MILLGFSFSFVSMKNLTFTHSADDNQTSVFILNFFNVFLKLASRLICFQVKVSSQISYHIQYINAISLFVLFNDVAYIMMQNVTL